MRKPGCREPGRGSSFSNGESQPSFFGEGYGIGIRVISKGALGFAATNSLTKSSVAGLARKAVRLAKASSPYVKKPVMLDDSKPVRRSWAPPETRKVENADATWLRGVLLDIEGRIADARAGVKLPGRLMYLGAELEERYYVNTDGARVEGRVPGWALGSLTAVEGSGRPHRGSYSRGRREGWKL